ncbi:MAG: class I SAM-dependent methyltransferase, partial [Solirubrobacteraceae bacterium]
RAATVAQVRASYATPAALDVYRSRVDNGLRIWEVTVAERYFPAVARILTIGCGAGRETFALEERGHHTIGVDISPPLLAIARELAAQRHHRSTFEHVDGTTLPFDDASFDVVTLWAQMLDNVPSHHGRVALLREVRRVLRTGGVATYSVHDDERTRPTLEAAVVLSADSPERGDLVLHERREDAVRYVHYFTRDELLLLANDAAFAASTICHTSDLGEAWGNVFVGICR